MDILSLLKSRKFILAVFGVLVLILNQYNVQFDPEKAISFTVLTVSFIIGIAIDPSYATSKWREFVGKREFWLWLVAEFTLFTESFGVKLPVSSEFLVEMAVLIGSFIIASSVQKRIV